MAGGSTAKDHMRDAMLRLYAKVSGPSVKRRGVADLQHGSILVIRPDHLGDLLFMTPALTLLRRALPQARIHCLVGPWGREVLANNPDVDEVITCDFPWFNRRPRKSILEPYKELRLMSRNLAEFGFDAALNLRFDFWWGALLAHMAGIPQIVGYDHSTSRSYLTKALPYVPRRHEVEQNLRLTSVLVRTNPDLVSQAPSFPLRFTTTAADEAVAASLVTELMSEKRERLIAVHPGSGAIVKTWTDDGFAWVAERLMDHYDARLIITGSKSERASAEAIASRLDSQQVKVLAGDTSIGQLAALFRRCDLVLGVDSGPLHLAVAVGTPTVHLFGPSDAAAFGPYGDRERHAIVSAGLFCSPCGRLDFEERELGEHECMRAIEPMQVLLAAEEVLGQTPENPTSGTADI